MSKVMINMLKEAENDMTKCKCHVFCPTTVTTCIRCNFSNSSSTL